jgi:signal peptidase
LRFFGWTAAFAAIGALVVLTVVPVLLPVKILPVWGASMEPTIHLGASVVAEEVPASSIRVGDIITFHRDDRPSEFVTHRVVQIVVDADNQQAFLTKGDANTARDPWQVPAVGVGLRARFSLPYLGYVYGWLHNPYGRYAYFAAIVLGVGSALIGWVWRRPEPRAVAAGWSG